MNWAELVLFVALVLVVVVVVSIIFERKGRKMFGFRSSKKSPVVTPQSSNHMVHMSCAKCPSVFAIPKTAKSGTVFACPSCKTHNMYRPITQQRAPTIPHAIPVSSACSYEQGTASGATQLQAAPRPETTHSRGCGGYGGYGGAEQISSPLFEQTKGTPTPTRSQIQEVRAYLNDLDGVGQEKLSKVTDEQIVRAIIDENFDLYCAAGLVVDQIDPQPSTKSSTSGQADIKLAQGPAIEKGQQQPKSQSSLSGFMNMKALNGKTIKENLSNPVIWSMAAMHGSGAYTGGTGGQNNQNSSILSTYDKTGATVL